MTNINHIYNWMPQYERRGFDIEDTEDFVFIKHKGIIRDVYTGRVTEQELRKAVSRLERECR